MSPSTHLPDVLSRAIDARADLLSSLDKTDCVRLLHGVAEEAPGVTIDRYGSVLLIQTWREPLELGVVDALGRTASKALGTQLIPVWNHRAKDEGTSFADLHPVELPSPLVAVEHGLSFDANPRHAGQDPLLFLDFRAARRHIRAHAKGKTVLNTFAYTCGIGIAALAGGATEAVNLDFAQAALQVGKFNAGLNGLTKGFEVLRQDYFPAVRQFAGLGAGGRAGKRPPFTHLKPRQFDIVVLDPPRWATSKWGAVDIVRDYPSLLKPALLATAPEGHVLATNHHPEVSLDDWLSIVRRTAEKAERPVKDLEVLKPDSDFPSFDGQPPLKMAWIQV